MSSKLEQFLTAQKIDQRQLLAVSADLESLRPADRALRLAKRQGKKEEGDKKGAAETRKPRSGRPLNEVTLSKIYAGKPVSGPTKSRLLRAVNTILERKKADKVELVALFDFAPKA
ncbi:MAG: hypothetical protein IPJ34_20165 [Myxococcales bacterium]|nr:hypothetical protein [Myxococcales bacterium]